MNSHDYIYAVARIRVKEKSLLRESFLAQLTAAPSEEAQLELLRTAGWLGDTAEEMLQNEEGKILSDLRDLGLEPSLLRSLTYPQLFHNLKSGIKEIVTSESHEDAFFPFPELSRDQILDILREKRYSALPKELQEIAPKAFELMLRTKDGQALDLYVDRAALLSMQLSSLKEKNPLLREYLQTTVVLSDIKMAVRAQKMRQSASFLEQALAPTDRLDISELITSACKDEDALYAFLERAGYGEGVSALKVSLSAFEKWADDTLMDLLRPERTHIESVGPVLAYYLARQMEIKTVRIILTAKRSGFPEADIAMRVRKTYV